MEHEREISVKLPLRNDGYLERACPHCTLRFSIQPDDYDRGGYLNLRCPRCGWIEEFQDFKTPEQTAYVQAVGENAAREMAEGLVGDQLKDLFRGLSNTPGVRVTSGNKRLNFGRKDAPSPNSNEAFDIDQCPTCALRYALPAGIQGTCPVCR